MRRWGCRGWGRAWHGAWGLLVVVGVVGGPGSIRVCSCCCSFVWVMRGRWLPLGVGIAPALRRVLVRRGTTSTAGEERSGHENWFKDVKIEILTNSQESWG